MAGTITFSEYAASRPAATTPPGSTDRVLILQGGAIKRIASEDIGGGLVDVNLINATTTPTTILPTSGEVVYQKSDDSVTIAMFQVATAGQTMCQELTNGLAAIGDTIRVKLIGTHWYKIGGNV